MRRARPPRAASMPHVPPLPAPASCAKLPPSLTYRGRGRGRRGLVRENFMRFVLNPMMDYYAARRATGREKLVPSRAR